MTSDLKISHILSTKQHIWSRVTAGQFLKIVFFWRVTVHAGRGSLPENGWRFTYRDPFTTLAWDVGLCRCLAGEWVRVGQTLVGSGQLWVETSEPGVASSLYYFWSFMVDVHIYRLTANWIHCLCHVVVHIWTELDMGRAQRAYSEAGGVMWIRITPNHFM